MPNPDLSECDQCLGLASRQAARAVTRVFERHFKGSGLRSTQFSLLVQLMRRGALTIGALARHLGVERTTLTRNIALIEKRGLVDSKPGNDARERIVAITKKGQAAVAKALPRWRQAQESAAGAIGHSGADALRKIPANFSP
ncbi:MAG TPA: MarR family winged helix-turn-helix transcriptional regulator [Xanthobacteraceae bacterium]|nr:MarR family winged helix-turn-helix transcriptional regulator [Xanthobacteraceae bacterium]